MFRRMNPLAIAATSFGFALVQLDVSILNVALVPIGRALSANVSDLQWVVDAYAIAFASLMLGAGAFGDRYGARRGYLGGLVLFMLASLGCGLAAGGDALIAARVLQGVGAALLVPCSLALLTHACGDDDVVRSRAISLWTAAASVSLSAGPLLGGMLIATLGWRGIFLVNLPVGAVGIWLTLRTVAETPRRKGMLDPAGQGFAILALVSLTGAMIEGGRVGFGVPLVIGGFFFAAACAVCFIVVEARSADPMVPPGFFRHPTFTTATLIGLAINLTLYGTIFMLGLFLQRTLGYSALSAGLAFLPLPIVLGIANVAAGGISARFGLRAPMAAGLLIAALGYWLLSHLYAGSPYLSLLPGMIAIPAGVGLAVPLMTSALLGTVPRSRSGSASGVLNTVRQASGGIGVALFGALLARHGVAGMHIALMLSATLLIGAAIIAMLGIRLQQPRGDVDSQRQDDRVEQEAQQPVRDRHAAELPGRDLHVRYLERHAQHQ